MHIARRKRKWKGGEADYLYLRDTYRPNGGQPRERVLYLGPAAAEDLLERSRLRLYQAGYTPMEIRVVLEAVRAFVKRGDRLALEVGGVLIQWRGPKKGAKE
jgi:hypothetical protein